MSNKDNLTFDDTIEWAAIESDRRSNRSTGIPIFYLIFGAVIFLILIILIIYLVSQDPNEKIAALEIMKNQEEYYDDSSYYGSYEEDDDDYIRFPTNTNLIHPLAPI